MACLLAGISMAKSLVLFGGWQAACRLDWYKKECLLRGLALTELGPEQTAAV
jgi:hypothetical protein